MSDPEPSRWSVAAVVPTLAASELELGLAFYGRLGFEPEWRWPQGSSTHAGLRRGTARLMLAECEPAVRADVTLEVDDADAAYRTVLAGRAWELAAGVPVGPEWGGPVPRAALAPPGEPIDKPYGKREFSVVDPWGNLLTLSQPLGAPPRQRLGLVALVVRDYDEALAFFVGKLGFELVEDTPVPEQGKRWVVVAPPGPVRGARLLLARASDDEQAARVGDQTGGRVALFLYTDDLERDHARFVEAGVRFVREPAVRPEGRVAVFEDLYGNLWDLLEPSPDNRSA